MQRQRKRTLVRAVSLGIAGAGLMSAGAWAAPTTVLNPGLFTQPVLRGSSQFKAIAYKTAVPNASDPGFRWTPTTPSPEAGVDWYSITMTQTTHNAAGLVDDGVVPPTALPGFPVWTYGGTYPAKTIDALQGTPVKVTWLNNLPTPHILPVDKTIMCGPAAVMTCPDNRTVVHVHGSHGYDHSDGLPEQWFTPNFAMTGTQWQANKFPMAGGGTTPTGTFVYPVDQDAATIWYHDHATGITRLNAYAGLAGFFLVRDTNELTMMGQAPNARPPFVPPTTAPVLPAFTKSGATSYPYEVSLAFQDKAFWAANGTATQPYLKLGAMALPDQPVMNAAGTAPQPVVLTDGTTSTTNPSIVPEFFGNIQLVNGVAWPKLDVEPRKYRFRFLNGNDSRVLILRLANPGPIVAPATNLAASGDPLMVIGTEQGFLNNPVSVPHLVLMPGMRYDVIIDFAAAKLAGRTNLVLQNIGPDLPFDGTLPPAPAAYPSIDPLDPALINYEQADPDSSGQLMQFNIILAKSVVPEATVTTTTNLRPTNPIPAVTAPVTKRLVYLRELIDKYGRLKLTIGDKGYFDAITEMPALNATEMWEILNLTPDAHPMHLHLVKFQLLNREAITYTNPPPAPAVAYPDTPPPPAPTYTLSGVTTPAAPEEAGYLDTVQVVPLAITRVVATFDIPGVYVWHCHILSHEEYDMMKEFAVVTPAKSVVMTQSATSAVTAATMTPVTFSAAAQTGLTGTIPGSTALQPATTMAFEYQFWVKDATTKKWTVKQAWSRNPTFIWTPPVTAGVYYVQADARAMGTAARQATKVASFSVVSAMPTGVNLTTPNPASQTAGTPVAATFTASGVPGPGPYEYQFWVKDPLTGWSVKQAFSQTSTFSWTPAATATPGTYYVQADIRAVGGTTKVASVVKSYSLIGAVPTGVAFTAPTVASQTGTRNPVTFTAAGIPTAGYEYKFWLLKPGAKWAVQQNWSSSPTLNWTTTGLAAGTYYVQVDVRQAGTTAAKAASKVMSYVLQ